MHLDGLSLKYQNPWIFRARPLNRTAGQLPPNSPLRLNWSRAVESMRHLMDDVSRAVRGHRQSAKGCELAEAFGRIPQELDAKEQIDFRIRVLGSARSLRPVVRDEIYHIGREALLKAFRHSRANCIEVELEYSPRRFRLAVRDDGCGINSQVLRRGRDDHWNLPGMRERAEKIGARLRAWSRAGAGTEV